MGLGVLQGGWCFLLAASDLRCNWKFWGYLLQREQSLSWVWRLRWGLSWGEHLDEAVGARVQFCLAVREGEQGSTAHLKAKRGLFPTTHVFLTPPVLRWGTISPCCWSTDTWGGVYQMKGGTHRFLQAPWAAFPGSPFSLWPLLVRPPFS